MRMEKTFCGFIDKPQIAILIKWFLRISSVVIEVH